MRLAFAVLCLAGAMGVCGCAHTSPTSLRAGTVPATSDALEVVPRGTAEPDVAQVRRLPEVDQVIGYPPPPGAYHALAAADCQCLAARASKLGNLYDGERRALAANESAAGCCQKTDNSLSYDVLRTAALEARNRSAGDALEAYYLLAQQEALLDLSARSLDEIRQTIAGVERLRNQGLKLPPDENEFLRRETTLREQRAQIERSISQLNAQLWQLIGLEPATPEERIWPTGDLSVVIARQDFDATVAVGLSSRPELGMLRRVRARLDTDSLPSARAALTQLDPLLGMSPQPLASGILGLAAVARKERAAQRELPERRRQLAQYSRTREEEVRVEVRQAAEAVDFRLRQIALAKEGLALWQKRLSDIEVRRTSGTATVADVALARLTMLQARSALVERVAAWKIAQARLKQAQGLLVAECCP